MPIETLSNNIYNDIDSSFRQEQQDNNSTNNNIPRSTPALPSILIPNTIIDDEISPLKFSPSTSSYTYNNNNNNNSNNIPSHRFLKPTKSILTKPKRYVSLLPPISLYVSSTNGNIDDATIYGTELNANMFRFDHFRNILDTDDRVYININPFIRRYRRSMMDRCVFGEDDVESTRESLSNEDDLDEDDLEPDTAVIQGVPIDPEYDANSSINNFSTDDDLFEEDEEEDDDEDTIMEVNSNTSSITPPDSPVLKSLVTSNDFNLINNLKKTVRWNEQDNVVHII